MRIKDSRVGLRLAAAFGVLVVMLVAIAGLGVWGADRQQQAQEQIIHADLVTNDLLQLKFDLADANGSEIAYALEAVADGAGVVDDTAGSRQEFLVDVQTVRTARDAFARHTLSSANLALLADVDASFEQFMVNDVRIAELYRSGTQADAAAATALLMGGQVQVFDAISAQVDSLADLVRAERVASGRDSG